MIPLASAMRDAVNAILSRYGVPAEEYQKDARIDAACVLTAGASDRSMRFVLDERDRTFSLMLARAEKAERALDVFLARDPEKPTSWLYTRDRAEEIAMAQK